MIFLLGMFWKPGRPKPARWPPPLPSVVLSCHVQVLMPDFPFMNRMGLVFLISLGLAVVISLAFRGRGDANRATMEGVSFRTSTVFNAAGVGVILTLIALSAIRATALRSSSRPRPALFEIHHRGPAPGSANRREGVRIGAREAARHRSRLGREINDAVAAAFPESRIFRIDHYLGKETVQNLLVFRFANMMVEPMWNRTHRHVQITVAESAGSAPGRLLRQDGALRDMVQNHMIQLLSLAAMEPPTTRGRPVRDEKVRCARDPPDRASAKRKRSPVNTRSGAAGGAIVPGYDEELKRDSDTETFVALKAHIDNWRWQGVPFYFAHRQAPARAG